MFYFLNTFLILSLLELDVDNHHINCICNQWYRYFSPSTRYDGMMLARTVNICLHVCFHNKVLVQMVINPSYHDLNIYIAYVTSWSIEGFVAWQNQLCAVTMLIFLAYANQSLQEYLMPNIFIIQVTCVDCTLKNHTTLSQLFFKNPSHANFHCFH